MAVRTATSEYIVRKRKLPVRVLFGLLAVIVVLVLILFALSPFLMDSVEAESGAMSPPIP